MAEEEIFKPPLARRGACGQRHFRVQLQRLPPSARCNRGSPFRALPLDAARAELTAAKKVYPHVGRVFLEEGDAFALPAARLAEIARLVHEFYPNAAVSCFASIHNIKAKSPRELAELRALGVNRLNVGAESGLDDVLAFMNKGFTAAETRRQLAKLRAAGIDFSVNIINGAAAPAGRAKTRAQTPRSSTTSAPPPSSTTNLLRETGSRLDLDIKSGAFKNVHAAQLVEEELEFIDFSK